MKKNISINLFGVLYNIDEDAYNLLNSYLQSMQRYFSRQEGGAEIADDIEHRVAELLWKRREAGMTAVDIEVVKDIIKTIGNPEEIADDGTLAAKDPKNFKESFGQFCNDTGRFAHDTYDRGKKYMAKRRFYRCANDKALGGVCSGLAIYFNAGDPIIWRLGAIALTLLVPVFLIPIVYIVMWLITPAAVTSEERLRQQGKDVNPDNLAQQVVDDSQPIIVEKENNGCLKGILVVIVICILVPAIMALSIWGKFVWHMFGIL